MAITLNSFVAKPSNFSLTFYHDTHRFVAKPCLSVSHAQYVNGYSCMVFFFKACHRSMGMSEAKHQILFVIPVFLQDKWLRDQMGLPKYSVLALTDWCWGLMSLRTCKKCWMFVMYFIYVCMLCKIYIQNQIWKGAGHIARVKENRWTKHCTEWQPRRGKRSRGWPRRRWQDDIAQKEGTIWDRTAVHKQQWKALMQGHILQWMDKDKSEMKWCSTKCFETLAVKLTFVIDHYHYYLKGMMQVSGRHMTENRSEE